MTDLEEKFVVSDIQYLMVYYLPRSKIHRHLCYNDTAEERIVFPVFYDGIVNTSSDIIIGTKKREKLVSSRLFSLLSYLNQ